MIGIVVLTYINWADTLKCVRSIFESEKKCSYHIYIVDNASPVLPDEEMLLFFKDARITYIRNEVNRGYSAGNNVGIKYAISDGCREILIANNDIIFKEDSIFNMYNYLNQNETVGIVGPKVFKPDGSIQAINMGVKTGVREKYMYLMRKTVFAPFVKDFISKFNVLDQDLTKPFEVHSVSGCCFMMSERCSRDLTPLDEGTFLYGEELIIGIGMEKKGYKTVYLTESEIIHAHGQSTKSIKAFSYICLVESELYYFKKYIGASAIQLFPLYFIRFLEFVAFSIKSADFRKNIKRYISVSTKRLFMKY
ncbi:glycosyltransferase family 2 protein [Paenibacillus sp. FSL M7-1046]|uniref:glycosyltransferase family 2 protein n=1 Tax=Paenibacillus sp. FSL M7-1046 TaxID=2975315 RepID=UPI0030FB3D70